MLKAVKVVGLNSDTEAALALISQPLQLGEETEAQLYSIVCATLDDAFSRARQATVEGETVFNESQSPIADRLPQVLEAIVKSLEGALNIQVLIACYEQTSTQNVFYLISHGKELVAHLIRNQEFTDLSQMSGEAQLVSGFLKPGDRVILSTQNIKEFLKEDLSELVNIPIDLLEDEINSKLPEAQVSPLATIVIEDKVEVSEPETSKEVGGVAQYVPVKEKVFEGGQKKSFSPPNLKFGRKLLIPVLVVLVLGVGFLGFSKLHKGKSLPFTTTSSPTPAPTSAPSNSNKVTDIPVWLDLNLIKQGITADSLSVSHNKLLVLDSKKEELVMIDLTSKSPQILAGEDKLGKGDYSSINGDSAWVYSEDKGVLRVDTGNQSVTAPIKTDKEWGNIAGIVGFAGNVYLLDKGKNQIWKYVPIAAGYSDKSSYFKTGVNVDLSQFVKFQIDSSVWILSRGGQISKFTQGSSDFFAFSGLTKTVKDIRTFFVSDETDNAYFLDTDNNRLLVTDKKGQYIAEYDSDKFQSFSDFVVDESNKKVYFLQDNKIFQMDLK